MKDYDTLAQRFAEIPDMEVSEETLGAYLEGNLSPEEMMEVQQLVENDPILCEMAGDITADDDYHYDNEYYDGYDSEDIADEYGVDEYSDSLVDTDQVVDDSTDAEDSYGDTSWADTTDDTTDDSFIDTDSFDCY